MPIIQIDSDTLIPIENHFKVTAGPGAGKTHWLVNHMINVLHTSRRLGRSRKLACITYTNVAVETILTRLGETSGQVEVCTFHSFLYRNIVKPYASFIASEYELDASAIDGHDDHIVKFNYLKEWIDSHPHNSELTNPFKANQLLKLPPNNKALTRWLSTLHYGFDSNENLIIKSKRAAAFSIDGSGQRRQLNNHCLNTLEKDFLSYKKQYWEKGVLHHDDILFFSYQLIQRFPFILQIMQAKFPYFFVDEFQDTNPIQTRILELIGQRETIVGVIGDKAQSIYSFQGASPSQFSFFSLPGMAVYKMEDNRRSTNQIIDFLNAIRTDIEQNKVLNREGEKPTVIIGDMTEALRRAQEICTNTNVCSLSRLNVTSNAMKINMSHDIPASNLFEQLYEIDSNKIRRNLIATCIKAIELTRQKHFEEAIKELRRQFRNPEDRSKEKKDAVKHLSFLLSNYDQFKELSLYDFYDFVKTNIRTMPGLSIGAPKIFYETHPYKQLAVYVTIVEDSSLHRTIHKAKGTDFENVLLVLREEGDLEFLLNPDLVNKEEHRINYVAVSRAKNKLFITLPSISVTGKTNLESLENILSYIELQSIAIAD